MKNKLMTVASVTASSLVSLSVYATPAQPAVSSNQVTKPNKTHTGKTKKAHLKKEDSNGTAEIKSDQAHLQQQLAAITQNAGNPEGVPGWYKHIRIGGLINVDASHWSKPNFGQGAHDTTSSSYLTLSAAKLNVDADAGNWVSGHVGLLYLNGSSPTIQNYRPDRNFNRQVNVEQAYATLADFSKEPFYLRAGEQYVPFGRYHLYPITQTLTQVISQTDLPGAQAGFISDSGFYASAYAASGEGKATDSGTHVNVYGAQAGYQNFKHPLGYDLGVGYLNNLANTDAIRSVIKSNNGYTRSVGGLSFYGDLYAGPFGFGVRYVTALRRFSPVDYQYTDHAETKGAKPSAGGLKADYNFKSWGHNSRVMIGYQWSSQAHNTASGVALDDITRLPKYRWLVGYGVNIVRHVALGLQFHQDRDYDRDHGGTNKKNNVVTARISYLF